jgi:hypothetical protein
MRIRLIRPIRRVAFLFRRIQTQQKTIVFGLILVRPSGSDVLVTVRIRFRRMRCAAKIHVPFADSTGPQKIIPAVLTGGRGSMATLGDVNWRCHPFGRFNRLPRFRRGCFCSIHLDPGYTRCRLRGGWPLPGHLTRRSLIPIYRVAGKVVGLMEAPILRGSRRPKNSSAHE